MTSLIWNPKRSYTNYKTETDSQAENKLMAASGKDRDAVRDGHGQTAIFKMDTQQGSTVQHWELCSMFYGCLEGRGVSGRMDSCICMAESLHSPPDTFTMLFISYTPIQNKKFFFFFKAKHTEAGR